MADLKPLRLRSSGRRLRVERHDVRTLLWRLATAPEESASGHARWMMARSLEYADQVFNAAGAAASAVRAGDVGRAGLWYGVALEASDHMDRFARRALLSLAVGKHTA